MYINRTGVWNGRLAQDQMTLDFFGLDFNSTQLHFIVNIFHTTILLTQVGPVLILIFKASLTSSNYLKTVSDIIIYSLGKYSLLLDFVMTKNKRGCIMNFPSENKITNLLFFSLEPIFNTIYGFLARIRRFLIFFVLIPQSYSEPKCLAQCSLSMK